MEATRHPSSRASAGAASREHACPRPAVALRAQSRPVRQPGAEGSLLSQDLTFQQSSNCCYDGPLPLKSSREVRSHKKFCFLGKILPITFRNPDEFQRKGLTGDSCWEQESRGSEEEGACDLRARCTSCTESRRKAVCAGGWLCAGSRGLHLRGPAHWATSCRASAGSSL